MNKYKHARVKGYAAWRPQAATYKIVEDVEKAIEQYREHLPLTIRQIFYRLVATTGYPKTERGYNNLCEYLNRARRAGVIPFEHIRDDGWTRANPPGWRNPAQFLQAIENTARRYSRDRQAQQPKRTMILVEAAGMLPQVRRIANHYSIETMSSSGFDSLTAKKQLADIIEAEPRPVAVLHVGDFDPSGVCIFDSIVSDVTAFVDLRPDVTFERIAVTPDQIDRYSLPTAPAKKTDRRGNGVSETCQAEALPPDVLAREIEAAILKHVDADILEADIQQEREEREGLLYKLRALTAA